MNDWEFDNGVWIRPLAVGGRTMLWRFTADPRVINSTRWILDVNRTGQMTERWKEFEARGAEDAMAIAEAHLSLEGLI